MAGHRHPRVERIVLLGIATMAVGIGALSPAAASARNRAQLESNVSEESATKPLQEPTTEAPSGEAPPSSEAPAGESSPVTQREERREERRARRAQRRARRDTRAGATCTVELEAKPLIVSGEAPVSLTGTLSCPEATSAAGQAVTLYQKLAHTPGFNAVATATTEADGSFHFAPATLEADSTFYVSADEAQSSSAHVTVAPEVTLSTPAAGTQLFVGAGRAARTSATNPSATSPSAVTFTGTVSPAVAGTTVALQREAHKEVWSRIAGGVVDEEGKFSITHTFLKPGTATLRVVVHSQGRDGHAVSTPVSYLISRRRERRITIQASANPIAYGLSVTITGTIVGVPDQALTLLAQTGDGAFAPIAESVANGNEYSFTESPLQSTRYRVRSATAVSGVLAEGVTALDAEPPASTVSAGGELTPAT
jgi:hypothetical protein